MGLPTTTSVVKSGESWGLYASMYGVSVDDLKKANNTTSDNLREGQTITIPLVGKNNINDEVVINGKKVDLSQELDYYDSKLYSWDQEIYNYKVALQSGKISAEDREAFEAKYIKAKNTNDTRRAIASYEYTDKDKDYIRVTVNTSIRSGDLKSYLRIEDGVIKDEMDWDNRDLRPGSNFNYDETVVPRGTVLKINTGEFNQKSGFANWLKDFSQEWLGI